MNKPKELIRKRGGKLVDLEGRVVTAEPIGKLERYRYNPRTLKDPYKEVEKYFHKAMLTGASICGADAFVTYDPRWITNKMVLHWEQKVQYYKLL